MTKFSQMKEPRAPAWASIMPTETTTFWGRWSSAAAWALKWPIWPPIDPILFPIFEKSTKIDKIRTLEMVTREKYCLNRGHRVQGLRGSLCSTHSPWNTSICKKSYKSTSYRSLKWYNRSKEESEWWKGRKTCCSVGEKVGEVEKLCAVLPEARMILFQPQKLWNLKMKRINKRKGIDEEKRARKEKRKGTSISGEITPPTYLRTTNEINLIYMM